MNVPLHWFTTPEWTQLVKTLLHSLWQGALVALALALAMRRLTNPRVRYRCSLAALAAILAAALVTWGTLNAPPTSSFAPDSAPQTTEPALVPHGPPEAVLTLLAHRPPASVQVKWSAWLAFAWVMGALAMLGRAGAKVAGAERLRRACQPLELPQIAQLLGEARRAVGLVRQVRIAVTDRITSPAVVGILVPTLILPLSLVTTLAPEQIRFILLHELAHIRRGDYFANLFQLFVESLLFFNPAVWWISHQVRCEREACCDALATELSGAPADYARTLVHVAERILQDAPAAAPAFGNRREPSSLVDRVQRLLVPGYRPSLRLTWRTMLAAFGLGTLLLVLCAEGTRVAVAQIAKPPSQATDQKASLALDGHPQLGAPVPSASDPGNPVEDIRQPATNSPKAEITGVDTHSNQRPAPPIAKPASSSQSPVADKSALFTRMFKVEPNTFDLALQSATSQPVAPTNVTSAVRSFFATLGLELTPPKSVYYNDRAGEILVRATAADLDVIEAALQVANKTTPQVNLKVKFIEIERGDAGADWYPGALANLAKAPPPAGNSATSTNSSAGAPSFTGILTEPQYRTVIHALEQRKGFSLLSEGEVTTLSGRQAQIQSVELRTIVNGLNSATGDLAALRELAKAQDEVIRKGREELAELRVKLNISDADALGAAPQPRVSEEEYRRYIAAKLDREVIYSGRKKQLDQLKALSKTQLREVLPGMLGLAVDSTLNELINELNFTDRKLASLNSGLGDKHPEHVRVKEQQKLLNEKIDARVDDLVKRLEVQLATDKSELDTLTESVESARKLDQTKLVESRPYYDKKREVEEMMKTRTSLMRKIGLAETYQLPPSVPISSLPGNPSFANTNRLQTQTVPFGRVLDVVPTVSADGHTIQMTATPALTEFLGYDDPKKVLPPGDPRLSDETLPLPRVRVRQVTTSVAVWDGRSLVLGLTNDQPATKPPEGGTPTKKNPDTHDKQLLVFITPTIVDPAGNRVNPP